MSYRLLTLSNRDDWNQYLERLPLDQQDVYFTPEYYQLYEIYGDGEAYCFIYEEGEKLVLYPFLRNSINSLGYELDGECYDIQGAYGYNGIVTSCKDPDFICRFHKTFDQFCKDNHIVAEFTRFHPLLRNHLLSSEYMKTFYSRHTVFCDVQSNVEEIWKTQIHTKNRNVIRKAEKVGIEIVESHDYKTFIDIYNNTMSNLDADGYYFFTDDYYKKFEELFKENGVLLLAMYEGQAIAGSMFMFSNDYAHYHLSGRKQEFYKLSANNLILWYGIQMAHERGCKYLHFGGGTTGEDDDSLLLFKQRFSKDLADFYFGKRIHNEEVYDLIVEQWKTKYPESYSNNKARLLGYREIK